MRFSLLKKCVSLLLERIMNNLGCVICEYYLRYVLREKKTRPSGIMSRVPTRIFLVLVFIYFCSAHTFAPSRLECTTRKSDELRAAQKSTSSPGGRSEPVERVPRGGSSLQTTPTKVPIGKSTPGGYAPIVCLSLAGLTSRRVNITQG